MSASAPATAAEEEGRGHSYAEHGADHERRVGQLQHEPPDNEVLAQESDAVDNARHGEQPHVAVGQRGRADYSKAGEAREGRPSVEVGVQPPGTGKIVTLRYVKRIPR